VAAPYGKGPSTNRHDRSKGRPGLVAAERNRIGFAALRFHDPSTMEIATMRNPKVEPASGLRRSSMSGWTVALIIAVVAVLGVVVWGGYVREQNVRANPPAVTAAPAPAAGVPAPAVETTTGERVR
jgi:hypothetical protein